MKTNLFNKSSQLCAGGIFKRVPNRVARHLGMHRQALLYDRTSSASRQMRYRRRITSLERFRRAMSHFNLDAGPVGVLFQGPCAPQRPCAARSSWRARCARAPSPATPRGTGGRAGEPVACVYTLASSETQCHANDQRDYHGSASLFVLKYDSDANLI